MIEIFKPTWKKILLTIVLFVLMMWIYFASMPVYSQMYDPIRECCSAFQQSPETWTMLEDCADLSQQFTGEHICEAYENSVQRRSILGSVKLIAAILLTYTISCLIIFAYNKVRKK